ncbi:hypothetical protein EUGRSUZ_E01896 [Eucalyptus grandis]|uniref:Uncharacterized protein n=2 Tax=Eucalyptus grandis TaxID=71139 RepID=A0ACC3KWC3_EUCGR|nr:hypothetical protein EUGRSUZ_E01896 [Eucalyptus grandis]
MAVEAPRVNPFPTQMITNRDFVVQAKNASATDFFASQGEDFIPPAPTGPPVPMMPTWRCQQQPRVVPEMIAVKKTESGLSSNYNANANAVAAAAAAAAAAVPVPRNHHKRSRDAFGDGHLNGDLLPVNYNPQKMTKASPFLGQEAAFEIQRYQWEVDRLISQHTERLRLELEDRAKQQSRALLSSIHDSIVGKLREKDEEIQRLGRLNGMLQEKVKNLVMENQIWRGLAQTNEAAANSLRSNLEHALARAGCGLGDDDAESCCGSNDPGRAAVALVGGVESSRRRGCRACGERESSVLLLPCRHLCLCAACGPSHHDCPACGSAVTASVHVNLSASS